MRTKKTAEPKRTKEDKIRLADFIHENSEQIMGEWESFARTLTPETNISSPLALRDHIDEILIFIIADIKSSQTRLEQVKKSHGKQEKNPIATAAETHAALRLAGGFNIEQMVSEYRALRASVIKLWSAANKQMDSADIQDIIRFNEAIDQELAESISHYSKKVNYSKDLFMGVLSHDLRSPLNVISLSAKLLLEMGNINERQKILVTQISESTSRIVILVDDLLDVTHARFGSGVAVFRSDMDMGVVGKQIVAEFKAVNPSRNILIKVAGDVHGKWDKARIGQVFSNLISNAVQYSFKDSPINVVIKGEPDEVIISIHNKGLPIPVEKLATLFDSLTRAVNDDGEHSLEINLGLGLYITKEIVESHGGRINVTSNKDEGTIFTARFPKVEQ